MDDQFKYSAVNSEALTDLVLSMPMPAHIKDAATGGYIVSNKGNLDVYGLSKIEDILGKNIYDLDSFMRQHWGRGFSQEISNVDLYVKQNNKKEQILDKIVVSRDGFVHIQDMTKIPIVNRDHNKVTAIFTYVHDRTNTIDLLPLFKIYKNVYSNPYETSKIFCHYLNIGDFFSEPLSCAELMLLLYAKGCDSRKELAKKACRSIKTIETHITHINDKLKTGNFLSVLTVLRSFDRLKELSINMSEHS